MPPNPPCYSPSLLFSPSPSSSPLSSSLPPSMAFSFPFPFMSDPPPPILPCDSPLTRPDRPRTLARASTTPIRHSCPASCCSHNLRLACHNSFASQVTSMLLHFLLAPTSTTLPTSSASSLEGVLGGQLHCCL